MWSNHCFPLYTKCRRKIPWGKNDFPEVTPAWVQALPLPCSQWRTLFLPLWVVCNGAERRISDSKLTSGYCLPPAPTTSSCHFSQVLYAITRSKDGDSLTGAGSWVGSEPVTFSLPHCCGCSSGCSMPGTRHSPSIWPLDYPSIALFNFISFFISAHPPSYCILYLF